MNLAVLGLGTRWFDGHGEEKAMFSTAVFIHRLYPDVCISRELNSFDVPPLIHAVCQCKSKQYFKHTFLEFSKMEIHFENLFFFFNKPQI